LQVDVAVIGGGPAGSAAARLLAFWGHAVVLVDRPGSDAGRIAESIPPSANKVLRAIGAIDDIQSAGFLPWRGNTVWWAGEPARIETFPDDTPGYQVLRSDFDRRLRDLAIRTSGVVFVPNGKLEFPLSKGNPEFPVLHENDSRGPIVIDASGRSGVLAREHGLRVMDPDRRTVALAGTWRNDRAWPIEDETHTLVASYDGGWAWSVPVDREVRQFTVMVDPSRSELTRGAPSREVYLAEVAKVRPFTKILERAQLADAPWGADASEYTARQYAGPGFLLAGDAGSAINPLSSFGVKKALASGWLAAIAAHTALVNPSMADEAFAFFDRRERAVAAAATRQASRFANDAARTGQPFWIARAGSTSSSIDDSEPDAVELGRDPAVLQAFADLRARPSLILAAGPLLRIEPRAAVHGREIVMEDQLISPSWPDGLRYLRGVDLVSLVRLAPEHRDVGELFAASQSVTPDIQLPDFLGALSLLISAGTLRFSSHEE